MFLSKKFGVDYPLNILRTVEISTVVQPGMTFLVPKQIGSQWTFAVDVAGLVNNMCKLGRHETNGEG